MDIYIGPGKGVVTGQSISFMDIISNINKQDIIINTNLQNQNFVQKIISIINILGTINKINHNPRKIFLSIKRSLPGILIDYLIIKKFLNNSQNIILHIHGMDIRYKERFFLFKVIFKIIWDHVEKVIILSNKIEKQLYPLKLKKNFIINNYSNKTLDKENINIKIKNFKKPFKVLYLSNLMYSKGVVHLIEALKNKRFENNFELILAGEIIGDEFYSKKKLQRYIDNNKNDRISFLGQLNSTDKWRVLKDSNIFILPSFYKSEFQPISIIEAMAFGCLVISTNHGAILESFGVDSIVTVKKNSQSAIENELIKILKNQDIYLEKIRNAYQLINKDFNRQKNLSLIRDIIEA